MQNILDDDEKEYMPVQHIYAIGENLKFSIARLRAAGMMKKAEAAQIVIDDIYEVILIQNKLINNLVYKNLQINQKLDLINARVGAYA